ncbi:MAG: lactate utilization protein [Ruminococcaceae bacterium]|nr:lactate utilization protein [Oscillospiraceae bacterium]
MNFDTIKNNLLAHGYSVSCFETAREAADYLDGAIDGKTVGMGGSVTLQELGICDRLATHNQVYSHARLAPGQTAADIFPLAARAQVYLSSVNGIAETGEIVNIDGNCNRISAMCFGHEKVYLIVGSNKIAPDYDAALWRARNIAAPKNAKRLGKNTPCAKEADRCYNCNSPERICRALSVFWERPRACQFEVILVNEALGY